MKIMKTIICSICGKKKRANAPAKYCFECARKKQKQNRLSKKNIIISDRCAFCDKKREHIHHTDLDKNNNELLNLLPLCWSCHSRVHSFILKPFIQKIVNNLKEKRYTIIEISEIVGLTRSRIYQILKSSENKKVGQKK